jgi:hypothetical protein
LQHRTSGSGLIDLAGLSLVVAALVQLLPRRREAEAVAST